MHLPSVKAPCSVHMGAFSVTAFYIYLVRCNFSRTVTGFCCAHAPHPIKSLPHTFAETVRDIPISEHLPPLCPALQHAQAHNQTFMCAHSIPISTLSFIKLWCQGCDEGANALFKAVVETYVHVGDANLQVRASRGSTKRPGNI